MRRTALSSLILIALSLSAVACGQAAAPAPPDASQPRADSEITASRQDAGSPPMLPNVLVKAEGDVWLRRSGWSDFLPVGFGAPVSPGDMLRVGEGSEAIVFCGDESTWSDGPASMKADGLEHGGLGFQFVNKSTVRLAQYRL